MEQGDQGFGENTLRWEKTEGGSDTPVLRELISSNNSKIPWRNQEIANGGLGVTVMVVHEKRRVKKSEGVRRGKFCLGI
jgi:hypothetical protein